MSLVAECLVDFPSYAAVLTNIPKMRLSVEQMAARDPETVSVTFWADGDEFDTLETGLKDAEAITAIDELSDETDGRKLYQVRMPAAATTYWEWIRHGGVLLDATISHEGLWMRLRFPDHDSLIDFRRAVRNRGCSFTLVALQSSDIRPDADPNGLTPPQRELLTMAVKEGYFDVPRDITMGELADRFEISNQAASERLRRALSRVVSNHVSIEQSGHRAAPLIE